MHVSTTTSDNRMNRFMLSNSHALFELFTNTHIHTVRLSLALVERAAVRTPSAATVTMYHTVRY